MSSTAQHHIDAIAELLQMDASDSAQVVGLVFDYATGRESVPALDNYPIALTSVARVFDPNDEKLKLLIYNKFPNGVVPSWNEEGCEIIPSNKTIFHVVELSGLTEQQQDLVYKTLYAQNWFDSSALMTTVVEDTTNSEPTEKENDES